MTGTMRSKSWMKSGGQLERQDSEKKRRRMRMKSAWRRKKRIKTRWRRMMWKRRKKGRNSQMMGRWKSCDGPSEREEGEARDDVIEEEEGETE
jgi:hypothetical protein